VNVTVVVLAYNGAKYLPECLGSLSDLPPNFQVLVVDNGSADESAAIARAAGVALVENGTNLGFSGGMNRGMRLAMGLEALPGLALRPADIVVLLNQDTRCLPGWSEAIIAPFCDARVGAVGCMILADDGQTILHVGGRLEEPQGFTAHIGQGERDDGQYHEIADVEYATGAALALRTSALREIGLLDERYSPAYMEEVDLCARLRRAGYRVVVTPLARVVHHEGISTPDQHLRAYWFNRGRLLFLLKHRDMAHLLGPFAEAERTYARLPHSPQMLAVFKRAYLDALIRLPDWYAARAASLGTARSTDEYDQLAALLAALRDTYVQHHSDLFKQQYCSLSTSSIARSP
jgi:GT2 family glycosyltransferase